MKLSLQGVRNFCTAVRRVVTRREGVSILADESTQKKRMLICKDCEYQEDYQCLKCECFTRMKTLIQTETCPENKW